MEILLKELGNIITGHTPSKKNEEYWNSEDICFVKPDIIPDAGVSTIEDSNEYIAEAARSKARVVGKNTVFVTCIGSIGKIGIAADKEYAFNQQINAIVPNNKVLPKYLAYNLLFNKPRLIAIANAPVVPIINKSQFGEFAINIETDSGKQTEIVEVLDLLTNIIELRSSELSALDDLIKARFVEMFGNPFSAARWTVKELGDLSESLVDGSNVDPEHYRREEKVLFLRIQNVWRNEFRLDDSVYITMDVNEMYYDTSLKSGDILITKIGRYYTKDSSLGRVALYRGEDDMANYSNNIMRVRLNDSVNSEYVNTLLNLEDYQSYIRKTSKGGTDKRALSKKIIEGYPVIVPPIDLQNQFATFVHQVNKSKASVQKALDETQLLFDSLMQKYFG